jgi:hypothetical protein
MRDPTRLLNSAVSEPELRLLRAGSLEEPPPEALQRLAATLGVRPSAVQLSPAGSTASAAVATKFPLAALVATATTAALVLSASVWFATRSADSAPAPAPEAVESQPRAAEVPAPAVDPAPVAEPVPRAALAEEIARLDAVRRLLAANRLAPALAALQSYERDYARGALRQEATLLRIEALQRAGRRAEARDLAGRYLADNPDSPHGPRIRALVYGRRNAR